MIQDNNLQGYKLSPQQRRMWLLGLRRGSETQQRARALVNVSGPVDLCALRRACELVTARHESLLHLFGEEGLPRNVYYGDGGRISSDEMAELVRTYEDGAVDFRWEEGDVLLVDNMLVAHGRRPYVGERKIVVAMGEMVSEQQLAEVQPALAMIAGVAQKSLDV